MLEKIQEQVSAAVSELLQVGKLREKDILVVGCSSSEIGGHQIGSSSSMDIALAVYQGMAPILQKAGVFLAAQCCEHLNRALIIEEEALRLYRLEQVNVLPQPKAGGSFASAAYQHFLSPVAVASIQAQAGMDIGNTLIGMHLAQVAVPVRLSVCKIGEAPLVCARTRPPFIGGSRAVYDQNLL